MAIINAIVNYRRHLKRRNYSSHTVKNYMTTLKHFVLWLDVPIEEATHKKVVQYIDHLLDNNLKPKTINCHLDSIRGFYNYLCDEEEVKITHPVKRNYALRLSRPLPRHLRDEEIAELFRVIRGCRDRAMFMLMLRSGLRVEEVANLTLGAVDLKGRRILVRQGKGGKDRYVPLPGRTLIELRNWYKTHRNPVWIFPAAGRGSHHDFAIATEPTNIGNVQDAFRYALRKSRVNKRASVRTLRHSYATHLVELSVSQAHSGIPRPHVAQNNCHLCSSHRRRTKPGQPHHQPVYG